MKEGNKLNLRKATEEDLKEMMTIILEAIESLYMQGSPQWQNGYGPSEQQILKDIKMGNCYVLINDKTIVGLASLIPGIDPVYTKIKYGSWQGHDPYVSIHRVAVAKNTRNQGVASSLLKDLIKTAEKQGFKDVRIDTHEQNIGMQKAILKSGLVYRGTVFFPIPEGKRKAYQYLS